jgi:acyl dehydratase
MTIPSDLPVDESPDITPEAIAEARALIGVPLRRSQHQWNTEASPDAVRQFCWAIGDSNPLFCDPDYGTRTRWGGGLAPGCFLYTIDSTTVAPKLRGVQWMYGGTEWEWYRPIRHRDRFVTTVRLLDVVEKRGAHAKSFVIQTGECLFHDDRGALVARAIAHTARTPRAKARDGLRYAPREPQRYSQAELAEIGKAIEAEVVQGAVPRTWESVRDGDVLTPVVKGPLTVTDMLCWYAGGGHTYQAHERAYLHRRRHPADTYRNQETGASDSPARGHLEDQMARDAGMPGGYDVGIQRISWLGHLVTNWIGDDGFCRTMNVRLRRPNIFGDVSWCRGRVVGKRIDDGARLVDLAIEVTNQRGENTADGSAVVELPAAR